jgi:GR25 family glycosyltransferase involved in LPS biosynthesis
MSIIEKGFVINLKRRSDRLENFLKQKNLLPNIEVFTAIDGRNLKYDDNYNLLHNNTIILQNDLAIKFKGLKIGEVGAFLSHYFIWKKIILENKPCIIFEDDAKVVHDFYNKLNNILTKGIPEDFDILWVGIRQHYIQTKIYKNKFKINKDKFLFNHYYNFSPLRKDPWYPYCYIISPNICKKLCNIFEKYNSTYPPVDHFICQQQFKNNYIIINSDNEPYLCSAQQGDSDIQIFENKKENNKYLTKI